MDPKIRDLLRVDYVHEKGLEKKFLKKSGKRKRKRKTQSRNTTQETVGETVGEASSELERRVVEVLPRWGTIKGMFDILIGVDGDGETEEDQIMYHPNHDRILVGLILRERRKQMKKKTRDSLARRAINKECLEKKS
eukprot:sb/3474552/